MELLASIACARTVHKMLKLWLWRWRWAAGRVVGGWGEVVLLGRLLGIGDEQRTAQQQRRALCTHKIKQQKKKRQQQQQQQSQKREKSFKWKFWINERNETKWTKLVSFVLWAQSCFFLSRSTPLFLYHSPRSLSLSLFCLFSCCYCCCAAFLAFLIWKYFRPERKRLIKPKEFLCNFQPAAAPAPATTTSAIEFRKLVVSWVL